MQQRCHDVDASFHPPRKKADLIIGPFEQSESVQQFIDTGIQVFTGQVIHRPEKTEILAGCQRIVQGNILWDKAYESLHGMRSGTVAHHLNGPVVNLKKPAYDADGCGLAGTIGTQQTEEFALSHIQT
jgi:hypothetical protein